MATNATLLKNRSLLTLGISESVSNTGNWITMMAVFALLVFRGNGTVTQSSGVFLAGLLPTLVISPVAGWLIDRFDRRILMIASEIISGVVISGLIFVQDMFWIYTLLALQAFSISPMTPARQAVMPDLVNRDQLTRANAFLQQLAGIIKIGAPMIAGAILAVLSPHQAIILDVISFGLSALILSRLPALPPHAPVATEAHPSMNRKQSSEKITSVLRRLPTLRLMFISVFFSITLIIGLDVLSPVYIRDVLHGNESFFGLMIGMVGMGTLIISVFLMTYRGKRNLWHDVLTGLLLLALIPAVMALVTQVTNMTTARVIVIAGAFLGGIGNGLLSIQAGTLLQILPPPDLLGRVSGVFQSTAVAGQLVGILVPPFLVPSLLSIGMYFGISALLLVGLVILMSRQPTEKSFILSSQNKAAQPDPWSGDSPSGEHQ